MFQVIQGPGIIVEAGSESTSQVLSALMYHLLVDPRVMRKLREEIHVIVSTADSPAQSLRKLAALPYLVRTSLSCVDLL